MLLTIDTTGGKTGQGSGSEVSREPGNNLTRKY